MEYERISCGSLDKDKNPIPQPTEPLLLYVHLFLGEGRRICVTEQVKYKNQNQSICLTLRKKKQNVIYRQKKRKERIS